MMLGPELLARLYRRIQSRRLKAFLLTGLQLLRRRYLVIRMDTTNQCNLRCRMCYYSAQKRRDRQEMGRDLFGKIAREVFPVTRFLYLSCQTEPLMNRNFSDFLDAMAGCGIPFTSFCTNGMLLTEKVVTSAIGARLSEIIFSVDGAQAETYEYIRRGAKWERLLAHLDLLRSAKAAAHSVLPTARINFTCMARNVMEMPALVQMAADHGVDNIHVRHLLRFTEGSADMSLREQFSYRHVFNDVVVQAQAQAQRLGVRLVLPDPIPESPTAGHPAVATRREANAYCLLPWFQAIITPTGDYRLCSAFPPFGNLRDQSFADIYHSPRMRELRRHLLRGSDASCAWKCHQEAYDVPAEPAEPAPGENVSNDPRAAAVAPKVAEEPQPEGRAQE
jgi:MoaA/NifB/PqqE/SkfB family radical SAM enzyme